MRRKLHWETAQVHPLSPDHEALKVPVVGAVVQHDNPYSGESYLLVRKEALFSAEMTQNLIPPFLAREAGLEVDDVPKAQSTNPTMQHHSMCFPENNLHVLLRLHGMISHFHLQNHH